MDKGGRRSSSVRLLLAALFSLVAAILLISLRTDHALESVVTVDYHDGKIYGINSDDNETALFCVDPISGLGTYYAQDYSDRNYRQFSDLAVADDGTVYVLQEKDGTGDGKAWSILIWDTKKNKLSHGSDIEFEISHIQLVKMSKMGDTVQMLFCVGRQEGDALFVHYALNGNDVEYIETIAGIDGDESFMLDDGRMVMVDAFGSVCYDDAAGDGAFHILKGDDGKTLNTNGTRFCLVGHKLYYKNYLNDDCYVIDLDAQEVKPECIPGAMTLPQSFDFYSTSCIIYDSESTLVCAVSMEDGRSVVGYNGIQDKVIDEVRSTDVDKLMKFVPIFLVCLVISASVALRLNFTADYLKKRSIKLRLGLSALVLTAAICMLFECYMQKFLEKYISWNAVNNCSAMAKIKEYDLDKDVLGNILSKKVVDSSDDKNIWLTTRFTEEIDPDGDTLPDNMNFLVFYQADDMIYSADQNLRYNIPVHLIVGKPMENMVEAAFNTNTVQSGTLVYEGDKIVAVCVPATLDSGQRYVLEAYMTIDGVISSMQDMNRRMIFWIMAFGIMIVIGIYAVISYCLRPLGYLRAAVLKVAEGELGAQAKVVGHNEVASTAMSFNRMSETLMRLNGAVDSYRRLYEAFVPMKLCEKLSGKDDIEITLEPGSMYAGDAYIMVMRFNDWSEDEQVGLIKTQLDTCMPGGGIAATLAGRQKIVFCDSADEAVGTAARLVEQLGSGHRVHIGIASTKMTVNVLGCASRRSMTVSEDKDAGLMEHLAKCLDASLVVSEKVMADLEREVPGKYHSRYLGRLSIGGQETQQALYEILDGEPQELRELKQTTAEHFDRGVRAYENRDMFKARTEMIRVKMDFPKDRASRSYILCCDRKEPPEVCRAEG